MEDVTMSAPIPEDVGVGEAPDEEENTPPETDDDAGIDDGEEPVDEGGEG